VDPGQRLFHIRVGGHTGKYHLPANLQGLGLCFLHGTVGFLDDPHGFDKPVKAAA
jgi:hypothetical protein